MQEEIRKQRADYATNNIAKNLILIKTVIPRDKLKSFLLKNQKTQGVDCNHGVNIIQIGMGLNHVPSIKNVMVVLLSNENFHS